MGRKIFKIFFIAVTCLTVAISVYLMVGAGGAKGMLASYNAVKPDSTSGFSKQLHFLQSYTAVTGDVTLAKRQGMSDEDIAAMADGEIPSGDTGQSGGVVDYGVPGPNDLRPYAKVVAQGMIDNIVSGTIRPNSGDTYYDTGVAGPWVCSFNGSQYTLKYACCTTMSLGVRMMAGDSNFVRICSGSYSCSYWNDAFRNAGNWESTSGVTWGQLNVGDVLMATGHTEIVVFKDGQKVYIANGGSDGGITDTASRGYRASYSLNSLITDNRNFIGIVRFGR